MVENPRWISATEYSPYPLPIARRQPIRVSVQPCSLTLAKTVLDRITELADLPNSVGTIVFSSTIRRRLFRGISRALAFFLSRPKRAVSTTTWGETFVFMVAFVRRNGSNGTRLWVEKRTMNGENTVERKGGGWNKCEDILIDVTLYGNLIL